MRVILRESGIEYPVQSAPIIRTPQDVVGAVPEIKKSDTEAFCVIALSAQNKMIAAEIVTTGLLDASLVHPREVFRSAITKNAAAIILTHNHPSGNAQPSAEDIRITRQLVEAGKIIDIKVLDHVVLGEKHFSMREEGLLQF